MIDYEDQACPEPFSWPLLILLALYTPILLFKEHPKLFLSSILLLFAIVIVVVVSV